MPGQTANGLPYPLPAEATRDGAVGIQNLAAALQTRGHGWRLVGAQVNSDAAGSGYTWFRVPLGGVNFTAAPFAWVQCKPGGSGFQFWFNPDDTRVTGEIGGFIRDQNGLCGNGAVVAAFVMLYGPIN